MTKTMSGAIDRAVECVMRNCPEGVAVEPRDICAWAVGAVFRYIRDEPEPTGSIKIEPKIINVRGDGMRTVRMVSSGQQNRTAALATGFTGDVCDACGNFTLKRTGTCVTCQTCGANTGCS